MQSGRILPTFRQFFTAVKTGNATKDRDPQQGQGQSAPDRDATEEEARRAAALLSESEEFKQNGIKVEVNLFEEKFVIVVRDRNGVALRMIKGPDIVRALLALGLPQSPRQGRILDRRI